MLQADCSDGKVDALDAGDQGINSSEASSDLPLGVSMTGGAGSPLSGVPDSSSEAAASAPGASDVPGNSSTDAALLAGRLYHGEEAPADNAVGLSKGAAAALSIFIIVAGSALIALLVYLLAPYARKYSHGRAWQERRAASATPYKRSVLSV